MKPPTNPKLNIKKFDTQQALFVAIFIALILSGYVAYKYWQLRNEFKLVSTELANELEVAYNKNADLLKETRNQRDRIISLGGQLEYIVDTVGTLEKLAQTDPELLKKYSKVYFLSENYVPVELTPIDSFYLAKINSGNILFHTRALPFLQQLLHAARSRGIELQVASAFRSFGTQASLKADYKVIYGAGTANQFSADQGYSEHQLGTSVDFTTPEVGTVSLDFLNSPAYDWLKDNANQYGFVLSYPEGNAYYKFEPWHWRFVGVELAGKLYSDVRYFYDLDQREIDAYLVKLFD